MEYLPTPGNKPMLGLVQLACGSAQGQFIVGMTDKPGYPTPADWSKYLRLKQYSLPLTIENQFRFKTADIKNNTRLLMVNYPHNPTGQIATREWWQNICAHCEKNNIRIFNDNPYYILSHKKESSALTEVAADFRNLSWAEAFSASKVISNGTGWSVSKPGLACDLKKSIQEISRKGLLQR